ncbi:aconitate hydratase AcnA [Nitratireductor basaltis]|uniref:Aconitate hydratase n=1 Tax=Nitratireductor basaltis TaxID=472175 RepID=A0A084U8Q7_9HYPH|nr:aconitate hydratase AcnA [Nitratireductor basaltis]KFB09343.1 Aconitase [Nitratireductor basaltis]
MTLNSFDLISDMTGARFIDLPKAVQLFPQLGEMPLSIRILFENLARHENGESITSDQLERLARGKARGLEIDFHPARVIMQDSAGMPALIDMAMLREKAGEQGIDPAALNPQVPADLIIDHSIMAHHSRGQDAILRNQAREFAENRERFAFMKWAQKKMDNLTVIPPGRGIIHQINIEYLADVVSGRQMHGKRWLFPDTVIGTDSHTTMVNGIGVLGWGVGGIEAEAVMLGEAISMLVPPVIGVHLRGELPPGVLATDLALTLTEALRKFDVVGAIVEFFGPGVTSLSVADRATIANMSPEFGSTSALFPVDQLTIEYLRLTGRSGERVAAVEEYCRRTGLWFDASARPRFDDVMEFDLSSVRRTVSGPSRPEQGRDIGAIPAVMDETAGREVKSRNGVSDGDIVIAAITSCTNTSNPEAMIAAGLLARNARLRGLTVNPRIKCSLAPGSRAVMHYLRAAGLDADLSALGFNLTAFGCTTCVGNSGEIDAEVASAVAEGDLCVSAILSGNRNFEARIHPLVKANFLASPPLVVAYALSGTMRTDLSVIGTDPEGKTVSLAELWPSAEEVDRLLRKVVVRDGFTSSYRDLTRGDENWEGLEVTGGDTFGWLNDSTYIQRPPFFDLPANFAGTGKILDAARPLLVLGDSVTTDHISPVGTIARDSEAAAYLLERGVEQKEFNNYGGRRGNHNIMARGTFANLRIKNEMIDGVGPRTLVMPEGLETTIFNAAANYAERGEQMVVVAGRRYGAGSARDWAAKGTRLLGVRVVLAESFERIHRSNLVRMGVLPLQFVEGEGRIALGLAAEDRFSIEAGCDTLEPGGKVSVSVIGPDNVMRLRFSAICRADTREELRYLREGGILPSVAKRLFMNQGV